MNVHSHPVRRAAMGSTALLLVVTVGCTARRAAETGREDSARVAIVEQQPAAVRCPGVMVHPAVVGATTESAALADSAPERIETKGTNASGVITVVATGPVLGSTDSREVATELACTAHGASLTATLTRSADYAGGVKKNVLWRPTVSLEMELRRPEVDVAITWRMRLSNGQAVDRAQTPPLPELTYPRTVSKRISAAAR